MKRILASAIFILMLIHQAALAGTIYKCKDAKGVLIFQQVACATGQGVGAKSFKRAPDSPNRTQNYNRQQTERFGSGETERLEAMVAEQEQAFSRSSGSPNSQADAKPSGYSCNDGRTQWIQSSPCPASTSRYESRTVNGNTNTGAPIRGTVSQRVESPVEEEGLSSSEMCEQLQGNPATKSRGSGSDSTYERNKMRDANGC